MEVDVIYTNGDSWVHGSELIDPLHTNVADHFNSVHDDYRRQHHWPYIVSKRLGLDYFDNSSPGSGNDRILRTSIYDISRLLAQGRKPVAVVAWSQLHRFELPEGNDGLWRSFSSPADTNLPKVAKEVWGNWSSDYADVIKWITQLISLHSFCRSVGVPILGLTVFSRSYRMLEDRLDMQELKAYKRPLHDICRLNDQMYQFSLESILKQYPNIEYGPGGHPLALGHETLGNIIAGKLIKKIKTN